MSDQPTGELTPYDTGDRCEPKLWQPGRLAVLDAMRHSEDEHVGKVDFEDDSGETVCTVHVERDESGVFRMHVTSFVDVDDLEIVRHDDPVV